MLAAAITAKNVREALNDIKNAKGADLIELRLDYLDKLNPENIKKIMKFCRKPVIATVRKNDEGGFHKIDENKRVELIKKCIDYGADFIDIEYSTNKVLLKGILKNKKSSKIIVSYHNFKETPSNLIKTYKNIKKLNPDLIKIVTNANSVADNFRIFEITKKASKDKKKIIAFCMGSYGQFSRILGNLFGSSITYASVDKGKESASGQLTLNEMVNSYRIKKINKNTKIAGLIGNPVEHSWSHIIHNSAFEKLKVNAVYLKFRVDEFKKFIDYFKKLNSLGFSVTIPHKIEAMSCLNKIDDKAKKIGAINTIVIRNKRLIGYNTDCDGAIQALKAKTSLKGKNVVILGAGGSSRAISYGLIQENADVVILNRTTDKAQKIAIDFGCNYGSLNALKKLDYDILINTTPIGMHPNVDEIPIDSGLIKKNKIVFDIVFNPYKTMLLKIAEKKNCTIIPGFEMLIYGAMLQFKLWTNKNAPENLMRNKVLRHLKNACY